MAQLISHMRCFASQSKKAKAAATEGDDAVKEVKAEVNYGPKGVKAGEHVFGVAHIYASFNDTFVVRYRTENLLFWFPRSGDS